MTKQTHKIFAGIVGTLIVVAAMLVIFHAPQFVNHAMAQGSGATNGDAGGFVHCGNEAENPCQVGDLFKAFIIIINYLIAMAGFIAVLAIVYAGFMMVYSQGQEQLKAAKGRLSGAIIGLVLVAAAFVLINAIFSGSLSVGVRQGADVLTSPLDYIQNGPSGSNPVTPTPKPNTKVNTNIKANSNVKTGK